MIPRKGMWVRHEGKTAIYVGGTEIHYVDENGETSGVNKDVDIDSLTQAKISEIPTARSEGESLQKLIELGYED